MSQRFHSRKAKVRGFVTPVEWDKDNKIARIAICTEAEDIFYVDDEVGIDCLRHALRAYVVVKGFYFVDDKGEKHLELRSIKLH